MSCMGMDTFCLVVNFMVSDWEPRHITVGIFEASDTARATLAVIVKMLLSYFYFTNKVISYVKDEGSNLRTLALTLTLVVSCKPLALLQPYLGVCFGHIMSKACQYSKTIQKFVWEWSRCPLKKLKLTCKKQLYGLNNPENKEQSGIKCALKHDLPSKVKNTYENKIRK